MHRDGRRVRRRGDLLRRVIAAAIAAAIGREAGYRPVATDGAARAAAMLAGPP